ncbi:MAG: PAS domain-containing sensor histidine kinase [Desulfarculus sp.]|nr:PAS domain-containing sensor histidine kinase [Desulfarculus sp.]
MSKLAPSSHHRRRWLWAVLVLVPTPAWAGLPAPSPLSSSGFEPAWLLVGLAGALWLGLQGDQDLEQLWRIVQVSRNKLKAIFDAISDPICSLTPQLRVESVNLALARRTGRHPRELVGLTGNQLLALTKVPESLCPEVIDLALQGFASNLPRQRLFEIPGEDGPLFFDVTLTPVPGEDGAVSLVIFQVRDVTALKRMEQTIREYSQSLEEMVAQRTADLLAAQEELRRDRQLLAEANAELRRLETLRHDLTNMVVHDMKGPLAEVMGNLDLLGYDPLSPSQREALDLATMAADDLLRMIMNLLDIDRLEEGRLRVRRQATDFAALAQGVLDRFQTLLRLKQMRAEIAAEPTLRVDLDPDLMRRVLQNLLTNALNHTPEGGSIVLGARTGGDEAGAGSLIWVSDSGRGIPEQLKERIFQKFVQGQQAHGPRTSTGLGLTFCKMAVEAHGGRIWFESREGGGTTFFIWLPESEPGRERPNGA